MGENRTVEELKEVFTRLSHCWEFAHDYLVQSIALERAKEELPELLRGIAPKDHFKTKLKVEPDQLRALLSELEANLWKVRSDMNVLLQHSDISLHILDRYRAQTGNDFFVDSLDYVRLARRAVKRGKAKHSDECLALKTVLAQKNQAVFKGETIQHASLILQACEAVRTQS